MKVLFDKENGKLLGAQLLGREGADKRCDVLATAIRGTMTAADLAELDLCYAPPYSSAKDPVNMAGFIMENILAGCLQQFHWEKIPAIQQCDDCQLLDVRTAKEYAKNHIDGAQHIPLDSLRERLNELNPDKKLYIYCHSGLRSYVAARILMQKGFCCYSLSGGFRLYEEMIQEQDQSSVQTFPCGMTKEP